MAGSQKISASSPLLSGASPKNQPPRLQSRRACTQPERFRTALPRQHSDFTLCNAPIQDVVFVPSQEFPSPAGARQMASVIIVCRVQPMRSPKRLTRLAQSMIMSSGHEVGLQGLDSDQRHTDHAAANGTGAQRTRSSTPQDTLVRSRTA